MNRAKCPPLVPGPFRPLSGLPGYGWQPVRLVGGSYAPHVGKPSDGFEARCINTDGKGYETLAGCVDACNILNTEAAVRP